MATRKRRTTSRRRTAAPRSVLVAQAIVRAASGKRLRGSEPITGRTLREHAPASDDVEAARDAFRAAGFEVGELGGISFSVSASKARFEKVFGVDVDPSKGDELPLDHLPSDLRARLEAVVFEPPADQHDDEGSALF